MRLLICSRHSTPKGLCRNFAWALIFEPRDLWVGVYWDRTRYELAVYICLIPTLPLRLRWVSLGTGREPSP